jgi:tetratricopeptide (TPR) repeat protein
VVIAIRLTLGLVYFDLAMPELARVQLEAASEAANDPDVRADQAQLVEAHLAVLEAHLGHHDSAYQRLEGVCGFLAPLEDQLTFQAAAVMGTAAFALRLLDENQQARRLFGTVLTFRRSLLGRRDHGFALDCFGVGSVELRCGRLHRAAFWYQLGIDILRYLYGERSNHSRIGDGLRGLAAVDRQLGMVEQALKRLDEADQIYGAGGVYGFDHPVRKALATTRDLLKASAHQANAAAERAGEPAWATSPPQLSPEALRRYNGEKRAIGNHARGFGREAEAVTALWLGDDLLDFGEVESSLESFEDCIKLAKPGSLLALKARMRRGQALAQCGRLGEARAEYQAVLDSVGRRGSARRPQQVPRVLEQAKLELSRLQADEAAAARSGS